LKMPYGKAIEIFWVNGTSDSLITAELSNWNGKAFKIPRIEISSTNRDELTQAGIYFLFCKEDDDSNSVYIGEAENVKERLLQHIRDYQSEKEKYYWNTAVIFIGRDLNKALIRYLENRLVEIARECRRFDVLTKNTYKNTVLKESQIAAMEEFVENIKVLINALGYNLLDPLVRVDEGKIVESENLLYISSGSVNAKGMVTSEGFVLFKGTMINEKTSEKSLREKMTEKRKMILESHKVNQFVTTEDILFTSSSAAGCFVLGYSVSGPQTWKTKDGKTLKTIEEEEAGTMEKEFENDN